MLSRGTTLIDGRLQAPSAWSSYREVTLRLPAAVRRRLYGEAPRRVRRPRRPACTFRRLSGRRVSDYCSWSSPSICP